MKKFVVVLLAVALLVGCGQEFEVKDSIREASKDPTSVMFRGIEIVDGNACVEYNAKNSFGAYAGWKVGHSTYYKHSGKWDFIMTHDSWRECKAGVERVLETNL